MMSSKSSTGTPESFDIDVPTTAEDVAALRQAKATGVPTFAQHIRNLSRGPHSDTEKLLRRPLSIGWEPFSLE